MGVFARDQPSLGDLVRELGWVRHGQVTRHDVLGLAWLRILASPFLVWLW
jgi:hypothetical protein